MELHTFDINNAEAFIQFNKLAHGLYGNLKGHYADLANDIDRERFVKAYMMTDNGNALARVVLYNSGSDHDEKPLLYFGNFEALGIEAGEAVLKALIEDRDKHYNQHELAGPLNGSTWHNYRIALDNFEISFQGDISGQSFYPELMTRCGFKILYRYNTNVQTRLEWKKHYENNAFHIVYYSREAFSEKLDEIYALTMEAFKAAPLFTPLGKDIFIGKYRQQLPYIDTRLIPFVLDHDGVICAYCSCYMDFDGKGLVLKTLARKPGKQYAGLGRLLSQEAVRNTIRMGADKMYHALMHESNDSTSLSAHFYGEPFKQYAVYSLE